MAEAEEAKAGSERRGVQQLSNDRSPNLVELKVRGGRSGRGLQIEEEQKGAISVRNPGNMSSRKIKGNFGNSLGIKKGILKNGPSNGTI